MRSVAASRDGSWARGWASAGTAAIAAIATPPRRRGEFFACVCAAQVTGVTFDGGYGEYLVAPASAGCAHARGTFRRRGGPADARRSHHVQPPCGTAVRGQARMSTRSWGWAASATSAFNTRRRWAITPSALCGKEKEPLAHQLVRVGLHRQPVQRTVGVELNKLGGAKIILATTTSGEAMAAVQGGLAVNGTMMVLGAGPSRCRSLPDLAADGIPPLGQGMVFRHIDRLAGHARLQRTCRRAADE